MQPSVRRAAAFAGVATLSLSAPLVGNVALAAVPFALIAVFSRLVSSGPLFELFARPADRTAGELRGLVGFSLAATGIALLASLASLPPGAFVAAVLLVGYGDLAELIARSRGDAPIRRAAGFALGGGIAALAGQAIAAALVGGPFDYAMAALLAVIGGLFAALLRAVLAARGDPVVMVSVVIVLWIIAALEVAVDPLGLVAAIGVAGAFGYLSWLLGTASVTGMLTGILVSLLTIVLGGYGWFVVLIAFFSLGGLASQFRYEEKREQGVAEPNQGARGGRNVLGNAAVALAAVVGFAASPHLSIDRAIFLYAFAGSVSTAMSDTLSSEIGVLFGEPRLITTMREVETGTDGGITVQGTAAGVGGAALVAVISLLVLGVDSVGAGVILAAGVAGMLVDSLLGATLEGRWLGNQSVNFLATLSGALIGAAIAVAVEIAVV